MKTWKAVAILTGTVTLCATPTASGTEGVNPPCCVARAMQWIPPGQKVTLICRDGSRPVGRIAEFDSTRGTLRFRPVDVRGSMRALPATDVVRLEWREPRKPSVAATAVGLVLGGLIGLGISYASIGQDATVLDLPEITYRGIAVTAIGAAVGACTGLLASASSHHDYAVDCRGNPEFLPPRARGR